MLKSKLKMIVQNLPEFVVSSDFKSPPQKRMFEDNSYRAIKKAQFRLWMSIGVTVVAVTAVVLFLIFNHLRTARDEQISDEYSKISHMYNQEQDAFEQKNMGKENPVGVADHAPSANLFVQFAKSNKDNSYGWQAALQSAAYYIKVGNLAAAQEVLEIISPYTQNSDLMQIKVKTTLATLYSMQKNYDKSIAELAFVENMKNNPLPEQAMFLKGKVLFLAGRKSDAQKAFNDLIARGGSVKSVSADQNKLIQQAKIWLSYISI